MIQHYLAVSQPIPVGGFGSGGGYAPGGYPFQPGPNDFLRSALKSRGTNQNLVWSQPPKRLIATFYYKLEYKYIKTSSSPIK
jgi:hypothetical protein